MKSIKKSSHSTSNILLLKPSPKSGHFTMLHIKNSGYLPNYVVFWSGLYNLNAIIKKHHTNPNEKYFIEKTRMGGWCSLKMS